MTSPEGAVRRLAGARLLVGPQGVYLICGAVVAGSAVICLRAIGLARPAPAAPAASAVADVALSHPPLAE